MVSNRTRGRRRLIFLGSVVLLSGLATAGMLLAREAWLHGPLPEGLRRATAFRTDLHVTLSAGGEVETAKKTLIECDLDNLHVRSQGSTLETSGSSVILEVIDDGSLVKRDDVLCRLDSSEYEELVRQQLIKVDQARSEKQKAELDLGAAEIALIEYRDGSLSQLRQNFREQVFLYEADIARQKDRIAWSENMVHNGYLSEGKLILERENLKRSQINLKRVRGESANLEKFVAPIQLRRLEAAVEKAQEELSYQTLRVRRREEQLARFQNQVELCTIRAPHDGMVIYANDDDDDEPIIPGASVHRHMDLFYIPDLSQMEIHATIHETVVNRVETGMPVSIRITGLPKYRLEGHITYIGPLPITPRSWRASREIKNFLAKIKLHNVPPDLLPGMTAQVDIITAHYPNALVIPSTAVTIENGHEICYLPREDGLERREVAVTTGTDALLQVTAGLEEGEEVVLDPSRLGPEVPIVATTALEPTSRPAPEFGSSPGLETANNQEPFATQ